MGFIVKTCLKFLADTNPSFSLDSMTEFEANMPADVPPLRSANHLAPLPYPSQFIMYTSGKRIGVIDSPETPCVRANRLRLRNVLLTGLDVQWSKKAEIIEQDEHGVTVTFQDGTTAEGDLLVGADGTGSHGESGSCASPVLVEYDYQTYGFLICRRWACP